MKTLYSFLIFAVLVVYASAYNMKITNPNPTQITVRIYKDGEYSGAYISIGPNTFATVSGDNTDHSQDGTYTYRRSTPSGGNLVDNSYQGDYTDTMSGWEDVLGVATIADGESGWTDFSLPVITGLRQPNSDPTKTLWIVPDDETKTLNAGIFREGVDKIVEHLGGSSGGSSSGGSSEDQTHYFGEQARLANQANATTDANTIRTEGGGEALGVAKAALVTTAFSARSAPNVGTAPSVSAPSMFDVTLPRGMGVLHLDPASNSKVASLATFIKAVISWVIFVSFQIFLWNYFTNIYTTLAVSQPAKGNPVAGGTGAQATSLLVATAITAVVLTIPTLFWALADSGATWTSTTPDNPLAIAAAGPDFLQVASYLVQYFCPVGTALAALSSYFLVIRAGLIMLAATQTIIRYIVF